MGHRGGADVLRQERDGAHPGHRRGVERPDPRQRRAGGRRPRQEGLPLQHPSQHVEGRARRLPLVGLID